MDTAPYHKLSVIPDIDRKILDAVAKGWSLQRIADEYSVSDVAILRRAQKHDEYIAAIEVGSELRMDRREKELEEARDNVSVTRADRLLGHARWVAEKTTRKYRKEAGMQLNVGSQDNTQQNQGSSINITFVASQQSSDKLERCINGESQVVDSNG